MPGKACGSLKRVEPTDYLEADDQGRSIESLARAFRTFAESECQEEPLYRALCQIIASDSEALRMLWAAPVEQQRPNLWLAAVHDLVLLGVAHPLCAYFPSVGGGRSIDADLAECFADFRQKHHAALSHKLSCGTTQTNEIGRCAVLWPVLQWLAEATGRRNLALFDFGTSAGLNLGVDSYRYHDGQQSWGAQRGDDAPVVRCRTVGPRQPPWNRASFTITTRVGFDVSPVDVHDETAVRWLRACLWPHDHERAERFDAAVGLARRERWSVIRAQDCIGSVENAVNELDDTMLPVVFNSWVLTYLSRAGQRRYASTMEELVMGRGAAWINAEHPQLGIGEPAPQPALTGAEYVAGTLWNVCLRVGDAPRYRCVARSHPHGKWLEWLA